MFLVTFFSPNLRGRTKKNKKMPKEEKNTGSVSETTAWSSEIGSLMSLDAPEFHASSDVREPISLHQAVPDRQMTYQTYCVESIHSLFIFYHTIIKSNSFQSPRKFDFSWYFTTLRRQRTCSNLQPKRSSILRMHSSCRDR